MLREVMELMRLRKTLRLSRTEVARSLGIPEFTLYRWESGRTTPRTLYLERLKGLVRRLQRMAEDDTDSKSDCQGHNATRESVLNGEDGNDAKKP